MSVETIIDDLYGPTYRLSQKDLDFSHNIAQAKIRLDNKIWTNKHHIVNFSFYELMDIYIYLLDAKLFYKNEWIALIREEMYTKIKIASENIITDKFNASIAI